MFKFNNLKIASDICLTVQRSRADLIEAKQRCEKARILVPRSRSPEKITNMYKEVDEKLRDVRGRSDGNGAAS